MITLVITLTLERLIETDDGAEFDIEQLLGQLPVEITEGDPHLSLTVQVQPKHVSEVRRAVEGYCTVDERVHFDLFDGFRR